MKEDTMVDSEKQKLATGMISWGDESTTKISEGQHDQARLTSILESFFVGNDKTYAFQQKNGKYYRVDKPLTTAIIERHIQGKMTIGTYLVPAGSDVCRVAVLDIDSKSPQALERVLWVQSWLRHFEIESFIEPSGNKGYHLWVLFKCWIPAKKAQELLQGALAAAEEKLGKPDYNIEVFPKQGSVDEEGFGNLIKLPWGYHKLTGNRTFFVDENGSPLPNDGMDVIEALPVITEEKLDEVLAEIPPSNKGEQSKETEQRQREASPCIKSILKGVKEGCRDEAAFALARFYASQSFAQRTTLKELEKWDAQNAPPLGNKILKDKVKSAYKGRYSFGCSSIKDNALLASFCQTPDTCVWAKRKDSPRELAIQAFQQAIVGNPQNVSIRINKITDASNDPSYELIIEGFVPGEKKVLKLTIGQLDSFGTFQQKILSLLEFRPFSPEHWAGDLDVKSAWPMIVEKLLTGGNFSVVQCPQEATKSGSIVKRVLEWMAAAPAADDEADFRLNRPIKKRDAIYFRVDVASEMLQRRHRIFIEDPDLFKALREHGIIYDRDKTRVKLNGKTVSGWKAPKSVFEKFDVPINDLPAEDTDEESTDSQQSQVTQVTRSHDEVTQKSDDAKMRNLNVEVRNLRNSNDSQLSQIDRDSNSVDNEQEESMNGEPGR